MKTVSLLGSTGSIGTQTLACCKRLHLQPVALTANSSIKALEEQARAFSPRLVVIGDESKYLDLKQRLSDTSVEVQAGRAAVIDAAAVDCDVVCNAIVGVAGLEPTLAALSAGHTLALSNKESLVAGGEIVTKAAKDNKVDILPVDSEHSAIFQCLQGNDRRDVRRILLTASGGSFRGKHTSDLENVTAEQALCHPNWSMGAKITVDSSTMMNKGLEVMEAMWLFGLTVEQVQVLVHPQSVLHSAVEFADGAVIGQMGTPDMAVPIQYALTYPRRYETDCKPLSLFQYGTLTFMPPDTTTFACLGACLEAAKRGGLYPCAVNGANEAAVELFLQKKIKFLDIGRLVWDVLEHMSFAGKDASTLKSVLETDKLARELVKSRV